jgi:uncharacterized membrane protein YfhO
VVAITNYSPDTVRIQIETAASGMLVLSDVVDPAWQARLDGAPAKIYVADGALRAVALSPGKHAVEFQYASAALPIGTALSALTLLALVAAGVRPKRHHP